MTENDHEQDLQDAQDASKPEVDAEERRLDKPSQAEGERGTEPDQGPGA